MQKVLLSSTIGFAAAFGGHHVPVAPDDPDMPIAVEQLISCPITNALVVEGCIKLDEDGITTAKNIEDCLLKTIGGIPTKIIIGAFCTSGPCYENTPVQPHMWWAQQWATHDATTGTRDAIGPDMPSFQESVAQADPAGTPDAAAYHQRRFEMTYQAFANDDGKFAISSVEPLYQWLLHGGSDKPYGVADRRGLPCEDAPPPKFNGGMAGLVATFSGWMKENFDNELMPLKPPLDLGIPIADVHNLVINGKFPPTFGYIIPTAPTIVNYVSPLAPATDLKDQLTVNTCQGMSQAHEDFSWIVA